MTSDEIKEQAAWILANMYGPTPQIQRCRNVADYIFDDLAAREAETAERSLPIDWDWLLSVGGMDAIAADDVRFSSDRHAVSVRISGAIMVSDRESGQCITFGQWQTTNRGQFLDLLSGFNIPTKTTETQ